MAARSKFLAVLSWIWFPIALLVLLVLALPGLILFVMHLLHGDATANEWLQEKFNLSYHLALPWGFALLLLLLPLLVILLYFLKLKRKALEVPSTFLWKKSIEDLHVNSLFQWLRQNVLLLLQLLILLVLLYAVMGFRVYGNMTGGKHYILMIDNSASMAATDLKTMTRLEWARQEALKEIDAAADNDFGMVIEFNSKASTLQSYTSNRAKLKEAVRGIQQTQRVTRIEEALKLADSLANPLQSTEDVASRPEGEKSGEERTYVPPQGIPTDVFLYSDGRFPDLPESVLDSLNSRQAGNTSVLGNLRMHLRTAGKVGPENTNNIGIVAFNALRLTDKDNKTGDLDLVKLQVLVRVRNYSPQAAPDTRLHLDVLVDGQLVHPEQVTLTQLGPRTVTVLEKEGKPAVKDGEGEKEQAVKDEAAEPGERNVKDEPGEQEVTFTLPPLSINANTVLHAYLPGVQDHFALDNEAWLAVGRPRKSRVLIVGPANSVLDAFFHQPATVKVASVSKLSPADLDKEDYRQQALSGDFDLVIFDRCSPKNVSDMPQANTFFIDQPPPPWERGKKTLKTPLLMVTRRNHPLLNQLTTLWDLRVAEIFPFDVKTNLTPEVREQYTTTPAEGKKLLPQVKRLIETTGNVPVLFTLARGSFTDLVMAFPLVSDQGDLMTDWPLQPSFPLFLRNVLYGLGNVNDIVRAESVQPGEPLLLRPEAAVHSLSITTPGGQKLTLKRGAQPYFAFTDTERVGVYQVALDDGAQRQFTVNLLDGTESNIEPRIAFDIGTQKILSGQERQQPHDFWKWIVVLALVLLLLEWYVYNRRVYI